VVVVADSALAANRNDGHETIALDAKTLLDDLDDEKRGQRDELARLAA